MQKDPPKFSAEDAMRLTNTPAGKQLLTMLQNTNSNLIQQAMNQASQGNMNDVKKTLAPLLNSPEIQKLLKELGGK